MSYVRIPVIEYGGLILLVKWSYLRKTHIHSNWLFGNKIRLLIADQSYCQAVLIVELYCSLSQLYGAQVLCIIVFIHHSSTIYGYTIGTV